MSKPSMITPAWHYNAPFRKLMSNIRLLANLNFTLVSNCMAHKTGDQLKYVVSY